MLKRRWLTLAMAAMVAGSLTACADDDGGGGGGLNDTGTLEGDRDTGRPDGTMDTGDDAQSGGQTTGSTEDAIPAGRAH